MIQLCYFLTCLNLKSVSLQKKCPIHSTTMLCHEKGDRTLHIFGNVKNMIYTVKYIFQLRISVDFNFGIASTVVQS